MTNRNLPLEQVEMLPHYGQHFPFIPRRLASKLRVLWVFGEWLFDEIGLFHFTGFWLRLSFRLLPTYREFREGFRLMKRQSGLMAEIEWVFLVMIYRDLEKLRDGQRAYGFAKKALQRCSQFMMNDVYQANRLAEFADPFEAFGAITRPCFRTIRTIRTK